MSVAELVHLNLTSPAVLAFVLGVLAVAIKSDLRLSEHVTALLSTYLLLAIGLKGGLKLRDAELADLWKPALLVLALGITIPVVGFIAARKFLRLELRDAAAIAAHYGSVSAVTFTAAETFNKAAGQIDEHFMPALVALMEIPGIIVALVIAGRYLANTSMMAAVREVISGKSIVLLVGGLIIGTVAAKETVSSVEPLFVTLFPGVLVLFLLDLGTTAGRRIADVRAVGGRLVAFGVMMPLAFGVIGTLAGGWIGMSVGGAAVLGTMAASASYIAAPAAVRVGLPDANLGLCLGASLGVTFPFNLIVGIPLFSEIAKLAN